MSTQRRGTTETNRELRICTCPSCERIQRIDLNWGICPACAWERTDAEEGGERFDVERANPNAQKARWRVERAEGESR